MVTTVTPYTDTRTRALVGDGFDGVVRVVVGNQYGSGVLLFDGTAVLTAAHLFAGQASSANVIFETTSGLQTVASSQVLVNPNYTTANSNSDLALVWLSQDAPVAAQRYGIYRGSSEIGQTMTMVGYGVPGSGDTGMLTPFNEAPVRVKANNQFESESAALGRFFGESGVWESTSGKQLVADFDNGLAQNDALGSLLNKSGLGLGNLEGLISKGDSGGPAFIGNLVAGIASFTARLSDAGKVPDIDNTSNSSFGEIAGWQRVSAYQQWIDQSLRAHDTLAPKSLSQVQKSIPEGDSGTSLAYFWVQLNGARAGLNETVSLDYQTRSGTAQLAPAQRNLARARPGGLALDHSTLICRLPVGNTAPVDPPQ